MLTLESVKEKRVNSWCKLQGIIQAAFLLIKVISFCCKLGVLWQSNLRQLEMVITLMDRGMHLHMPSRRIACLALASVDAFVTMTLTRIKSSSMKTCLRALNSIDRTLLIGKLINHTVQLREINFWFANFLQDYIRTNCCLLGEYNRLRNGTHRLLLRAEDGHSNDSDTRETIHQLSSEAELLDRSSSSGLGPPRCQVCALHAKWQQYIRSHTNGYKEGAPQCLLYP